MSILIFITNFSRIVRTWRALGFQTLSSVHQFKLTSTGHEAFQVLILCSAYLTLPVCSLGNLELTQLSKFAPLGNSQPLKRHNYTDNSFHSPKLLPAFKTFNFTDYSLSEHDHARSIIFATNSCYFLKIYSGYKYIPLQFCTPVF